MRRLAAIAALLVVAGVVAGVVLAARPAHHCFSGPIDPGALRHHPAYLCRQH